MSGVYSFMVVHCTKFIYNCFMYVDATYSVKKNALARSELHYDIIFSGHLINKKFPLIHS